MIHYHVLPITPESLLVEMKNKHLLVNFFYNGQIEPAIELASSIIIDNGAFSVWKSNKKFDLDKFYAWLENYVNSPRLDFFFIPDKICGTERENDILIKECPFKNGVPIWHTNESLERLERLSNEHQRIAIGSSAEHNLRTTEWWERMVEAFNTICDLGKPRCKVHGLRMLNKEIVSSFPFSSGDSSTVARHSSPDNYLPHIKNIKSRLSILVNRIEESQSPSIWENKVVIQKKLL